MVQLDNLAGESHQRRCFCHNITSLVTALLVGLMIVTEEDALIVIDPSIV